MPLSATPLSMKACVARLEAWDTGGMSDPCVLTANHEEEHKTKRGTTWGRTLVEKELLAEIRRLRGRD